jgi:hypothetical protein
MAVRSGSTTDASRITAYPLLGEALPFVSDRAPDAARTPPAKVAKMLSFEVDLI